MPFGNVVHEHEFTSGAAMMSSSVQLSSGIHSDAPNMAYVFSGQVSHLSWPKQVIRKKSVDRSKVRAVSVILVKIFNTAALPQSW